MYQTVTTVATVGFREVRELDDAADLADVEPVVIRSSIRLGLGHRCECRFSLGRERGSVDRSRTARRGTLARIERRSESFRTGGLSQS